MSEWKSVPSFPTYQACSDGRIRNKRTGKVLKPSVHKDGLSVPAVSLVRDHVYVLDVRYIIACTFLGVDINERPKPKLEYIDGNKFNNAASNIQIRNSDSLEREEWRPIQGFETSYAISNFGRVKRLARIDKYIRKDTGTEVERFVNELIIKNRDGDEYYEVNLFEGSKSVYRSVHRLVAQAFIPNPDNLPQVNHINGDKHDNRAENLEWSTSKDNVVHAIRTGLRHSRKGIDASQKQVRCIETGEIYPTIKDASTALNISASYFTERLQQGKTCHGLHFEVMKLDRRVKCLDTGEIFNSLKDAEIAFGVSIGESIKCKTCSDGWTFCYLRDNIDEPLYLEQCRAKYSLWPRANKRWEKENYDRY